MDDLDLDRDVRTALAVTPSPEFVARLRTMIARQPRPSRFAGWAKPAAAIACVVVLALAIELRNDARPARAGLKPSATYVPSKADAPSNTDVPRTTSVTDIRDVQGQPVAVVVQTFSPAVASAKVGRSATLATPANEPPLPEVIIAPDDIKALQQFVAGANELRFVASFVETPAPMPWVVADLSVAPIMIEPLDQPSAHN